MIHYADDWLTVYQGDCREVMAGMEAESVHCVVTSPPYWGLRDYGEAGQLGLEPTPEAYVANMVAVFREVRRVLRKDGTVWLNLGDSYAASPGQRKDTDAAGPKQLTKRGSTGSPSHSVDGLKPKDLVGIPWRVAFALQADGWYLRSDIIWAKPNPMPESVTDRPTKAHEYLFLLTKSARYFYDQGAVMQEVQSHASGNGFERPERLSGGLSGGNPESWTPRPSKKRGEFNGKTEAMPGRNAFRAVTAERNLRSVWTIATQPYPGAHFATFPEALVEPCVKAGTSERGVCPECGAPWLRETERSGGRDISRPLTPKHVVAAAEGVYHAGQETSRLGRPGWRDDPALVVETTGWRPSCTHNAEPVGAVVLDPFGGSGTTARVANRLSRRAVLIDLSTDYLDQAMVRNAQSPMGLVG